VQALDRAIRRATVTISKVLLIILPPLARPGWAV
jgi:hypothetical protein